MPFLLTCLLRGMTNVCGLAGGTFRVSTHMPLARHDPLLALKMSFLLVSTHMPLARHDHSADALAELVGRFYSHASCEA